MDYLKSVETAPPGWRHFTLRDLDRLPPGVRKHDLARVPSDDVALAAAGDAAAAERLLRAMFWTLIYHLDPQRWDELARFEPIHPDLLRALPRRVSTAVDVGAGSGRLTQHLVSLGARVTAVEPSAGLRALLKKRFPTVRAVAGWAESLPLADHSFELTTSCGAFGPDPMVLDELVRVTAPGGAVVLISPESPDWFEQNGWQRISAPPMAAPPHPSRIDDFFGPLDPPHEMVMLRVAG